MFLWKRKGPKLRTISSREERKGKEKEGGKRKRDKRKVRIKNGSNQERICSNGHQKGGGRRGRLRNGRMISIVKKQVEEE